jgi:hypothetical protein
MSNEVIKYAFVAGEVSPSLYARSDLEKYDLGLALAKNWFVDYRGGVSTRAGTQFIGLVMADGLPTKFFKFQFSPTVANAYVLLFGDRYIRFIQNGGYVLEPSKVVTSVAWGTPAVVTSVAHGFVTGDWVEFLTAPGLPELIGRNFTVGATTADTFELKSTPAGGDFPIDTFRALTANGTVARIYTLVSVYDAVDLADLKAYQIRDTVRLTHQSHVPRNLQRIAHTNWVLSETQFVPDITPPTNLNAAASDAGGAGTVFAVTAIDDKNNESVASERLIQTGMVNYTLVEGSDRLTWDPVAAASYYNVYRANIAPKLGSFGGSGGIITRAMDLGYLGRTKGTEFRDTNIIPDFTRSPPQHNNPFADASIKKITPTLVGTGYTQATVITVTDAGGGAGWSGYPIVVDGEITAVVTEDAGHDYVTPVVAADIGTGATFDVSLNPATGNFPAVSSVFQQRQIYAATVNEPLTIFASRPGRFDNFDTSFIVSDADEYEHELDTEEITSIHHLFPMRGGLLIFTQTGIWQLSGTQGGPVTPTNALADPQSYTGCASIPPLRLNTDLLYIEGRGTTVRMLGYSEISKVYSGTDVSILANHLVHDNQIEHWDYANDPFKLVYAQRSDGALLTFTTVKEQNLFAWTQNFTRGLFEDVIVVQEGGLDRVYVMVDRRLQGRWTKCLERFSLRNWKLIENACCVDSSLSLPVTRPDATVFTTAASGGSVHVTSVPDIFTADDVGKVLRMGFGKMTVTTFVSPSEIIVDVERPITRIIPEEVPPFPIRMLPGEWSLDTPVTEIGGLWHLEGETVSILADGNVVEPQMVVDGKVTLPNPVTRIFIGLAYSCVGQTLPPVVQGAVTEGRRKRVVGVAARLNEARGIKMGARLDKLYEMKERTTEEMGTATLPQNDKKYVSLEPAWSEDAQTYFVQDQPLPATILGFVIDIEVGDDTT